MPLWSSTVSRQNATISLALLSVASVACRIRNDSQLRETAGATQVPVVQLEEIATHPLELLEPVATIPDLRASPGPALALLVATHLDEPVTERVRETWGAALGASAPAGTPVELIERGFLGLDRSPLFGTETHARASLVFEAAVMNAAADFGAVTGATGEQHPRLLALHVLHSDATLATYAGPATAADAGPVAPGAEPARPVTPHVVAATIVRSVTGELWALAELGAPPTFPGSVGSVAMPGGALHVEGSTAVIVLGNDPWFARAGFARKLHEHHAATGTDPAASLGWAREQLAGHSPIALALVTRQRHAVWTSPEAFSAVHTWEPSPSGAGGAEDPVLAGSAAPTQDLPDAGGNSPAADAGANRSSAP